MHSIDEIRVFERHSRICTGCAYFENVVTIGLGSKDVFRQYYRNPRKTRIRMLVQYLAHEFGHIQQFQLGRKTSERDANWIEAQVLKTFDEKANELVKTSHFLTNSLGTSLLQNYHILDNTIQTIQSFFHF
jgi:predicted SprT family Zn-dependent metalloprotease